MNKAGVSHEPRPSIFDHLPAVSTFAGRRHSHTNPESDDYIDTHTKSSSLPMRDHSKRRLSERIRKGAKNRISQLFWETEYGRQSGSSSSVASSQLALAEKRCPCGQWLKAGRLSNMSVYTSSTRKFNNDVFVNEATMERQGTKTYEENSTDTENNVISVPSPVPNGRGTSLPTDDFCHSETVITNRSDVARRSSDRFVRSYSTGSRPIDFELHLGGNAIPEEIDSCTSEGPLAVFTENKALPPLRCSRPQSSDLLQDKRHLNSATITVPDTVEEREIKDAIQICNTNNSDVSRRSSTLDISLLSRKISDDILITPTSSWDRKSKTPVRRTRTSIASISSYSSNKTDFSDVGTESSNFSLPASVPDSPTADRKLDVVFETQTEKIKKQLLTGSYICNVSLKEKKLENLWKIRCVEHSQRCYRHCCSC